MKHELPKLNYEYDALEPFIDAETMKVHHQKHHQAYTDKFNAALEKYPELFNKPVKELLKNPNELPEDIKTAVINNGGGYFNHNLFWEILGPNETRPEGELGKAIIETFGSVEQFIEKFTEAGLTQFGSGWAWLCVDKERKLSIKQTSNQDSPLSQGLTPILALDVWEHAYYLKYQNRRPDYINSFWKVVNFRAVEEKYNVDKN